MIVFDLACSAQHRFEAWFASSAAYDDQASRGLLSCPVCGDGAVTKAVMAPNVAAKGNRRSTPLAGASAELKAMLGAVAAAQAKALETSQWVGGSFAERARAMHDGAEPHAIIHGQATPEEARALHDDGVAVMPLLVPVVPPELAN